MSEPTSPRTPAATKPPAKPKPRRVRAPKVRASAREPAPTLGKDLQKMSHLLQALILSEPSVTRKKELRKQLTAVLDVTAQLVDRNVGDATDLYRDSTAAVEQANAQIVKAMQDLGEVAATIEAIARAVDLLAELAAMAP
ncbi:hypothetical protein ACW73L_03615 [Methylolobus aquaticus]